MKQLAQLFNPAIPAPMGQPTTATSGTVLGNLFGALIGILFIFGFFLTFLYMVLGGLQWVSSGGEKAQLESARNKITHAFVGLILIGGAWAIMTMISAFFGLGFPTLHIPTINQAAP
jgi:hypothetical protein